MPEDATSSVSQFPRNLLKQGMSSSRDREVSQTAFRETTILVIQREFWFRPGKICTF